MMTIITLLILMSSFQSIQNIFKVLFPSALSTQTYALRVLKMSDQSQAIYIVYLGLAAKQYVFLKHWLPKLQTNQIAQCSKAMFLCDQFKIWKAITLVLLKKLTHNVNSLGFNPGLIDYGILEIKPCGLGSRIRDMEADLIYW